MGIIREIFKNVDHVYVLLDGIKKGKLISEIYANHYSSTFYKIFKMLESGGFIVCHYEQKGRIRIKKCRLTEKGEKLLDVARTLIELDRALG